MALPFLSPAFSFFTEGAGRFALAFLSPFAIASKITTTPQVVV
jgi:hypothetical protein